MLSAVVDDFLGCLGADVQYLMHLIGGCRVDIDELTRGSRGASTGSCYSASVGGWRFTDGGDVDFLAIAQPGGHVQCDKIGVRQRATCHPQ